MTLADEELATVLTEAYGSPEWTLADVCAARAIESAATAPLLARIAELEAANEEFGKRQEWWNTRMLELERELEDARKDAERYRRLRAGSNWPAVFASHDAPEPLRGEDLDAAIKEQT